jgi:putative transposase
MPRLARAVFQGIPHHITQRGNRREDIFFTEEDRLIYLAWLREYTEKHKVQVLAYCLMTNHVHLILIPSAPEGLHNVLKPLHMRYAQRVNRAQGWTGHVWQGRYFSSPLDEAYTWAAVRYVECNPVRARMVASAEVYRWSSAAAHCGLKSDPVLTKQKKWIKAQAEITNWSEWLAETVESEKLEILRRNINKGLPCGSDGFIERLSKKAGRNLNFLPRGRPRKKEGE